MFITNSPLPVFSLFIGLISKTKLLFAAFRLFYLPRITWGFFLQLSKFSSQLFLLPLMCQKRHWYFLLWTLSLSIVNFKCPPHPKKRKKEKRNLGWLLEVFWDSCLNMKVTPLVILHRVFWQFWDEFDTFHQIRPEESNLSKLHQGCFMFYSAIWVPCSLSGQASHFPNYLFPCGRSEDKLRTDMLHAHAYVCVCVRVCGLKAKEDN